MQDAAIDASNKGVAKTGQGPAGGRFGRFAKAALGRSRQAPSVDIEQVETLLARVALGDRKAFSALYDLVSPKLFGIALRIVRDRAGAEDVTQEAFMKIWRHADSYVGNGIGPMAWMSTIARNTAIDRIRVKREMQDVDEMTEALPDSGPTPEQIAIAGGEAARIQVCMMELDGDRRIAVRGAYLEGRSYAELAQQLNVPLNTMRTWLRRSLISLRECMSR